MTIGYAILLIDGLVEAESDEQLREAAQLLIDSGLVWTLPGSIGRMVEKIMSGPILE
jgi:hypothetical protein